MAVESADDRAVFFNADDFGVAASFTPSGGSASTVNGIIRNVYFEAEAGGNVGVSMQDPMFICRTADVPSVAEGDALSVSGTAYTIRVVEPDGTGMTRLMLEKN
jgi:hypothetical protein